MKKLIFLTIFTIINVSCLFGQTKKVNVELLESLLINRINEFRVSNGLDTLIKNDTVKLISEIECQYLCDNGLINNPNTDKNFEYFFGDQVYSSYTSNIVTRWTMNNITDWYNIEKRMVDGYMLRYFSDKTESTILVSKKDVDQAYKGYIGLTCKVQNETIYVSQVIYITK